MAEATDDEEDGSSPTGLEPTRWDVRETRIRQARKVIHELKRVADAKGMTMNALITVYIDAGLKQDGRRGVHELAPWFNDYLRRKGGPNSRTDCALDNGEDFT